jgi:hypothetical protein
MSSSRPPIATRKCKECGTPFRPKRRSNAQFCSDRCRKRSSRRHQPRYIPRKNQPIPPIPRGLREITGSRQPPYPPVQAPLPLTWEIWLLDEEIERGADRMAHDPVAAPYRRLLERYPQAVPQIRTLAGKLTMEPLTNRNRDPFPDTLETLERTWTRNAAAAKFALERSSGRRAQEELHVATNTGLIKRLDRQDEILARVELLQRMFGETLDHIRRTVDELGGRFPEDARIQKTAECLRSR